MNEHTRQFFGIIKHSFTAEERRSYIDILKADLAARNAKAGRDAVQE